MADNVTADPGSGGSVFRSHDIGGVQYPVAISAIPAFDHGRNSDIDNVAAEQITASSIACRHGVWLHADPANTGIVYIGNSDVTIATADGTDGWPMYAGNTIFVHVENVNLVYAIASAANQVVHWRSE